ncbi:helix-turn-helix transcriptional regulator [bacterium]|nr:helix-turn-helix transcriptional regulator [bacterium]
MESKSYKQIKPAMADPVIVKEIGGSLRHMRLNKNISQEQLARMAGVDRTTISRMEAGRAATLLTLVQVLRALDKLDILNVFSEEPQISPLQVLKMQERQRQKASPKRKPVKNKK